MWMVKMWEQLKILSHHNCIKNILDHKSSIPIHIEIEPMEACNHKCIFCHWYNSSRRKQFKNLDFKGNRTFNKKRLLKLIDELDEIGTKAISFTGAGEPLLYPHMAEILDTIYAKKINFGITSNLNMRLSGDLIKSLSHASWIRCSIDAGTNNKYKLMHNANRDIKETFKNIEILSSLVPVNISYVITSDNVDEILLATKYMKYLETNSISFRPDTIFNRTKNMRAYNNEVIDILQEAEKYSDDRFSVYINLDRLNEGNYIDKQLFCYYSNHSIYIAVNGDAYPCCMTRYNKRYVIGNIMDTSFIDFWNSDIRKQNYLKLNMKDCPSCRHTNDNLALEKLYKGKIDNFI